MSVVVVNSIASLAQLFAAIDKQNVVAVDCEGVNLSRHGSVSIISIAIDGKQFVVDLMCNDGAAILSVIKNLMESADVCKIIHDARQDVDALVHLCGIRMVHVFDTQVVHALVNKLVLECSRLNLNDCLSHYNIPINHSRMNSRVKYRINSRYWETRPLTSDMIECASGDVVKLFSLRNAELKVFEHRQADINMTMDNMLQLCLQHAYLFANCTCKRVISVSSSSMGMVIGTKGSNIERIQRVSGAYISQYRDDTTAGFMMIAHTDSQLNSAESMIKASTQRRHDYYY